jgi:hypothetical protein
MEPYPSVEEILQATQAILAQHKKSSTHTSGDLLDLIAPLTRLYDLLDLLDGKEDIQTRLKEVLGGRELPRNNNFLDSLLCDLRAIRNNLDSSDRLALGEMNVKGYAQVLNRYCTVLKLIQMRTKT